MNGNLEGILNNLQILERIIQQEFELALYISGGHNQDQLDKNRTKNHFPGCNRDYFYIRLIG